MLWEDEVEWKSGRIFSSLFHDKIEMEMMDQDERRDAKSKRREREREMRRGCEAYGYSMMSFNERMVSELIKWGFPSS